MKMYVKRKELGPVGVGGGVNAPEHFTCRSTNAKELTCLRDAMLDATTGGKLFDS